MCINYYDYNPQFVVVFLKLEWTQSARARETAAPVQSWFKKKTNFQLCLPFPHLLVPFLPRESEGTKQRLERLLIMPPQLHSPPCPNACNLKFHQYAYCIVMTKFRGGVIAQKIEVMNHSYVWPR